MALRDKVHVFGGFCYALPDVRPGNYVSYLVARKTDATSALADFKDKAFAFNGRDSLSGYAVMEAALHGMGYDVP